MFVVQKDTYENKKTLLRKFLKGYYDSAEWMIKNPEEAAKIAVRRAINGRNQDINLEIIKLRNISAVSETTRVKGLGAFDLDLLQKGADTFKQLGLIKTQINISSVVKSDLIPKPDKR